MIEANATNLVANFIIGIIGSIIFIFAGLVDFSLVLPLFLGNLFGGWIGSKLVLKKGNRWARLVVIVVLLTAIIKLVFFP